MFQDLNQYPMTSDAWQWYNTPLWVNGLAPRRFLHQKYLSRVAGAMQEQMTLEQIKQLVMLDDGGEVVCGITGEKFQPVVWFDIDDSNIDRVCKYIVRKNFGAVISDLSDTFLCGQFFVVDEDRRVVAIGGPRWPTFNEKVNDYEPSALWSYAMSQKKFLKTDMTGELIWGYCKSIAQEFSREHQVALEKKRQAAAAAAEAAARRKLEKAEALRQAQLKEEEEKVRRTEEAKQNHLAKIDRIRNGMKALKQA